MSKQEIIQMAQAAHAQWPQYAGHWQGSEWVLVEITRRVVTKGGVAFEPGDITIARPPLWIGGDWTAYSLRNRIDTRFSGGIKRIVA